MSDPQESWAEYYSRKEYSPDTHGFLAGWIAYLRELLGFA